MLTKQNRDEQNERKEIDSVLNMFSKSSSIPDDKFMASLQKEYISTLHGKHIKPKFSILSFMQKKVKVAVAFFVGILVLGSGGAVFLYTQNNHGIVPTTMSQDQILASIVNRNGAQNTNISANSFTSNLALNNKVRNSNSNVKLAGSSNGQESSAASTDAALAPNVSMLFPRPMSDRNFSHTSAVTTAGPAYSTCQVNYINIANKNDANSKSRSESYTYITLDGEYKTKYVEYDKDNSLVSYNLYDNTMSIDYLGGNYAQKHVFNTSSVMPMIKETSGTEVQYSSEATTDIVAPDKGVSEPMPTEPVPTDLTNYFGPDTKVEGVEKINGVEYYVVSWSYDGICNPEDYLKGGVSIYRDSTVLENDASAKFDKLYNRSWYNKDSFEIFKTETYVNAIESNNLVSTYQVTTENKDISSDEAKSIFAFDYNVEVREFTDPVIPTELELLQTYLSQNSVSTIWPENMALGWFNVKYDYSKYQTPDPYTDRAFYSAGAKGDAAYNYYTAAMKEVNTLYLQEKGVYAEPEMNFSFSSSATSNSSQMLNVSVYKSDLSDTQIIADYATGVGDVKTSDGTIKIDGINVATKIYQTSFETGYSEGSVGVTTPGSAPSTDPVDSVIKREETYTSKTIMNYLVVFTYNGYKYRVFTYDIEPANLPNFEVLNPSDSVQKQKIIDRATNVMQNILAPAIELAPKSN